MIRDHLDCGGWKNKGSAISTSTALATNMLFSRIFAEEEPADDKGAAKAEEAASEKTKEALTEEEAEPEDVSGRKEVATIC